MNAAASLTLDRRLPAHRTFSTWLVNGWRLFRSAPLRILLLTLFPIVVEGLLQLLPGLGIVLSKLLTPLASAWVLALLDCKARGGFFAPSRASRLWWSRLLPLLSVLPLSAAFFGFQLLVAAALGGSDQAVAFASGDIDNLHFSRIEHAVILASGMLASALLLFVMPRVLLDGVGVAQGLGDSVRYVVRYWRAVAMFTLLCAALIAVLLWLPVLLLVLLPFAKVVGYTAYRDVFDRSRAG